MRSTFFNTHGRQIGGSTRSTRMISSEDTPPSIVDLLDAVAPPTRRIALHVTVGGRSGERAFWMTEGGAVYFRRTDGRLNRATQEQANLIMRGLELARRSSAFNVQGRMVDAAELDLARGLLPS
jgi:hypothetical protein